MKKFLKIFFVFVLVIIVIAATVVFIFLKTFDLDKFKDRLLAQASHALKTKAAMETIDFKFSWSKGVVLKVSGISIDDLPGFSDGKIFSLKEANLQLDLKRLILNRQIIVTQIILEGLEVNLVRDRNGEINAQKLIPSPEKPQGGSAGIPSSLGTIAAVENSAKMTLMPEVQGGNAEASQTVPESKKNFPLPNLLVRSIFVKNGTLLWTDELIDPPMKIICKNIDLKISDLAFDKDFPFELNVSILSDQDNLKAEGFVKIDKNNSQVFLSNVEAETDLSIISLEQLLNLLPQMAPIGLEDSLKGEIIFQVNDLAASAQGLTKLSSEINIQGGSFKLKQLALPFEDIQGRLNISELNVKIEDLSMGLAGGRLSVTGELNDYWKEQTFHSHVQMEGVLLQKLIDQNGLPAQGEGKINGDFNIEGAGFTPESLKQSFKGTGGVQILEGQLVNLNILNLVFGTLSMIPDVQENLTQNLPEKYKVILASPNTVFDKIESHIVIKGDKILVTPVEIATQGFLVEGKGELDFEQNVSAEANLLMAEDLSAVVVTSVPQFSSLLNEQKQIYIPFESYQGKLAHFKMLPDRVYLAKNAGKALLEDQIKKVIPEDLQGPAKEIIGTLEDLFKKF